MKSREAVKGAKKSRKDAKAHTPGPSSEEARQLLEPGERSDRDAIGRPVQLDDSDTKIGRPVQLDDSDTKIGRPVQLDDSDTKIGRPVQLDDGRTGPRPQSGGVTEDMPDEQGGGTQRQQTAVDDTRIGRR